MSKPSLAITPGTVAKEPLIFSKFPSCVLAPGGTMTIVGVTGLGVKAEFVANALRLDKAIQGCRYGTARPQSDFPMLAELYLAGRLKIDELITRHYAPVPNSVE